MSEESEGDCETYAKEKLNDIPTGVVCPHCGHRSLDLAFCDHCQFELPSSESASSHAITSSGGSLAWNIGSFGIRWPESPWSFFETSTGSTHFRMRGLRPELWALLRDDVLLRQSTKLNCLPPIHLLELDQGAIVLAEKGPSTPHVDGPNVAANGDWLSPNYRSNEMENLITAVIARGHLLATAMTQLHSAGFVWFDFDPTEVERFHSSHSNTSDDSSSMRITNLDWRLTPIGRCPTTLSRVSPMYSPPEICRFHDELIGPRTDVYHLALSLYYQLARLGSNGFEGRGLEAFGFDVPPLRVYCPELPAGIWPILKQALSITANGRQESVLEFMDQLESASLFRRRLTRKQSASEKTINTPDSRQSDDDSTGKPQQPTSFWTRLLPRFSRSFTETEASDDDANAIAYDIYGRTTTGRAKQSLGAVNQDAVCFHRESLHGRDISVLIVADGVSTARVGSGDLASGIACDVVSRTIRERIQSLKGDEIPDWDGILENACFNAGKAIFEHAIALPNQPPDRNDTDVMSSTILIGILDGHDLVLANVGDSRAYLVFNGVAEQLTVDGDAASSLIACGVAPEQVMELGNAGKALRYCLGACRIADDGRLEFDPDRSHPQIAHWTIGPDDTFVLCSDGLVEERVFLNPEDLVSIVCSDPFASSKDLTERLIAAADERQRLPNETEPYGYGDNISCIVVRRKPQPNQLESHPNSDPSGKV